MYYRVSEIASMLGLSMSALRFFEDRGLIYPTRNEDNGYRMYEPIDLNRFLRIKTYAQCGFSLEEIVQLLQHEKLSALSHAYHRKADELEKEIAWKTRCLGYMRDMEKRFFFAKNHIGCWTFLTRPAMYCFAFRTREQIEEGAARRKLIRQWTQYKPLTQSLAMYTAESFDKEDTQQRYGMLIEDRYADATPLCENEFVVHYPMHERCAYTVFERKTGQNANTTVWLHHVLAQLRAQGEALDGDIIGRVLHTGADSNENLYFVTEYWLPSKRA